jgi:hypothetical protein
MNVYGFPEDEKRHRAEAWVTAWRTLQASTQRVERERAERALTALYRERGLETPDFIWADDPADAVTAWHIVALGREPVRNLYANGDTGTGRNRDWHRLRDPFGLEPEWVYRARRRAEELAPSGAGGFRSDGSYAADTRSMKWHLEERLREDAPPRGRTADAAATIGRTPRLEMLSRLIIGDRWGELSELLGSDRVVDVAIRAAQQAAVEILSARVSRREAMRSLTFPAFDHEILVMATLSEVLGIPLWRQMDQRPERTGMVERRLELARTGVAYMALDGVAIMLDRPTTAGFDASGRLHGPTGPALQYPGGTTLWFDHGVEVPADVITDPASITVERIDKERNAEVRRVMTERFGPERLVREGNAELIDEDEVGRLWRRGFPGSRWNPPEPVVMVEVRNSTPEPDGSVRTYFLRVPPTTRSAREAVAWTFGLQGTAYEPAVET